MRSYNLKEEFSLKGEFWTADHPDYRLPGTIHFTPSNGPVLDLLGMFEGDPFGRSPIYSAIHGHADLQTCALVNASRASWKGSNAKYTGQYLVIGHRQSVRLECQTSSYRLNHLGFFLQRSPFTFTHNLRDDDGNDILRLDFRFPQSKSFTVPGVQLTVGIHSSCGQSQVDGTASFDYSPILSLTSDTLRSHLDHLHTLDKFCSLFSLLTNETVVVTQIGVRAEAFGLDDSLCYRQDTSNLPERDGIRPLIEFPAIEDRFEELLRRRFANSETLQEAFDLFESGRVSHGETLQARFLVLTQAIEAFSRAQCDHRYLPVEAYAPIRQALDDAIPDYVTMGHKAAIRKKIEFGYEYSLRKRITLLLRSLSNDTRKLVCKSNGMFVSGIADTRNYLTHYTDDLRLLALRDEELYWACERVAVFLRILLLKYLGLEESFICERLMDHMWISQHIKLAREFREAISIAE